MAKRRPVFVQQRTDIFFVVVMPTPGSDHQGHPGYHDRDLDRPGKGTETSDPPGIANCGSDNRLSDKVMAIICAPSRSVGPIGYSPV
jgi:hypothetical protein